MKSINKILIIFASVILILGACIKQQNIAPANDGGGLITVLTPAMNYVIGANTTYIPQLSIQQGDITTTKVDAYMTFHTYKRNADGTVFKTEDDEQVAIQSNEKLFTSITIADTKSHIATFEMDLASCAADLSVTDNDFYTTLPTDETMYMVGDYWSIRLVSTTSNGDVYENYRGIELTVSTRFAGTYKVIEGQYFRIGEGGNQWVGENVIIKSVDATVYEWYEWGILSGWTGNTLYFTIDNDTGEIIYLPDQVLNDQDLTYPEIDPGNYTFVMPIAGDPPYNIGIKDDVDGKDRLKMMHGYYTPNSGAREFYFLLEKQI